VSLKHLNRATQKKSDVIPEIPSATENKKSSPKQVP